MAAANGSGRLRGASQRTDGRRILSGAPQLNKVNLGPFTREDDISNSGEDISIHVNEEHSNDVHLFDLNTAFEDVSGEEILHEEKGNLTGNIDLNQLQLTIARPRFDSDGNVTISGKIGIFHFTTQEPAKRTSANRVAGTLERKEMTSIGRDIGRSFLIHKVLPVVLEKWPREDGNIAIRIQQDNARTHIDHNDEEFRLLVNLPTLRT
ncbi:hypothetical protein OROMI_009305 [Orobanche minor]